MSEVIYFDNQATTQMDDGVLDEMLPFFVENFGNPHSVDHTIGWKASQAIEQSKHRIADLIGSDSDEIIFTSGATESNNLALLGVGKTAIESDRKRILVSTIEHKCVLACCSLLEKQFGYTIEFLPVDQSGFIDLEYLEQRLANDVLLVSIILVNNEIGTIQDISSISKLVRQHGAILHTDAAQAATATEISKLANEVEMLSLSGHKMYGPQGIGILYVRRKLQSSIEPLVYGGGQQNNIRSGTLPLALCVGIATAAKRIKNTFQTELETVRSLTLKFIDLLSELPHPIVLNGPALSKSRHPGNANIQFIGFDATEILGCLQPRVAASTGSACTSGVAEPSHVLQAIGLSREQANSSIRFSLSKNTTGSEVHEVVKMIDQILSRSTGT